MKRKIFVFFVCVLTIAAIFFLFPINMFDGEIVFEINKQEIKAPAKLSLSYFIGIGANETDLKDVKNFYLLPMGYFLASLMLFGLPSLIAYRIGLKKPKK